VDYRLKLSFDCDRGVSHDEERDREVFRNHLSKIEHGIYDLSSAKFDSEARRYREHGSVKSSSDMNIANSNRNRCSWAAFQQT
jgi:hypothetical protein